VCWDLRREPLELPRHPGERTMGEGRGTPGIVSPILSTHLRHTCGSSRARPRPALFARWPSHRGVRTGSFYLSSCTVRAETTIRRVMMLTGGGDVRTCPFSFFGSGSARAEENIVSEASGASFEAMGKAKKLGVKCSRGSSI
jgi:hypothetical protein